MKKIIKSFLYKILGLKQYLRLLYRSLSFAFDAGFLKNNPTFSLHYFAQKMVFKGDHVLDIGANLGYYTRVFLRSTGKSGKVFAVEPIKPFIENIEYFLGKNKNLILMNYALGLEEKDIQLSVPDEYGYLRTGLPRVYQEEEQQKAAKDLTLFPAKMVKASLLFENIERLDYLKMDIEGYEKYVIPEMKTFLRKHLPCIQVEVGKGSKIPVNAILFELGYEQYFYKDEMLTKHKVHEYSQDFFYIHPSKIEKYKALLAT